MSTFVPPWPVSPTPALRLDWSPQANPNKPDAMSDTRPRAQRSQRICRTRGDRVMGGHLVDDSGTKQKEQCRSQTSQPPVYHSISTQLPGPTSITAHLPHLSFAKCASVSLPSVTPSIGLAGTRYRHRASSRDARPVLEPSRRAAIHPLDTHRPGYREPRPSPAKLV